MIEGIPEGWELVEFRRAVTGDYYLNTRGLPERWIINVSSGIVFAIIRKIEKPKQYRAFRNAAEFEPHRLRWWKTNGNDRVNPPAYYNDSYHGGLSFDMCFVNRTFDDGTPFGIEVTE